MDNKLNIAGGRKSMQLISFDFRSSIVDDETQKKSKIKKLISNGSIKGLFKKSSLGGMHTSFQKANKEYSQPEFVSENEKSPMATGQIDIRLSAEEIRLSDNKRKQSIELFNSSKVKFFHPKVEGIQPKYFHKIKTKSIVIDSSMLGGSQNKSRREKSASHDFTKKNLKLQVPPSHDKSRSASKSKQNPSSGPQMHQKLKKILNFKGIHMNSPEKNPKKEVLDFYLNLLRKLELLRFSLNYSEINEKKIDPKSLSYSIEIENVKIDNLDEKECYASLTTKFGKDYFVMLKKIFSSYGTDKKGLKVLTSRRMCQLAKDFSFYQNINGLDEIKLQIFFIKRVPQKNATFRDFIDLLYNLAKLRPHPPKADRVRLLKLFLDELIVPKYREFSRHLLRFSIDYIQVFYKDYNPYDNPTVGILFSHEDFFKHIFSLYENFDISVSQESYMTVKGFLKFCQDYSIISHLSKHSQLMSIFRIFQSGEQEIINYHSFIMALCCVAHIVFSAPEHKEQYKGFYKKISMLISFLERQNDVISDSLMISNFQSLKN